MINKSSSFAKVGIIGISGYTGGELLGFLLRHPQVRVTYVCAQQTHGPVTDIWPHLRGSADHLVSESIDLQKAVDHCDLIFLAVPHTTAMAIVPVLRAAGKIVIDLSGDYRILNADEYTKWYGAVHTDPENLPFAVYGMPELYREKIRQADLISNPGCYPTAVILGLAPLLATHHKDVATITIDAKSGVSGAGKKAAANLIFGEVAENFKAYKVFQHQHTPEIEQQVRTIASVPLNITFVTYLLPVFRGILASIYVRLHKPLTDMEKELFDIYRKFYKTEPYVRVVPPPGQPELKNVKHSNYCDIGVACNGVGDTVLITAAIDNLVKGAAGQAIQNMNIRLGLPETQGLTL